ncbi:MAG: 2-hydroxymuconate tautomerase family protein [Polyangiaceae bacterium]|nr:2-hydroxymuconate tautomerase family protein [Polyangiaceae bacterium]
MPLVEVTLIEGRTKEQKVALMRALTDAVESTVGAPRESIRVVLREVPPENWAVGGVPRG